MFERSRGRAVDLSYAAGWGVIKQTPRFISERAFQAVADTATVRNGGATRQLRKNLRRVVGPHVSELRMDQLVGDSLRSYSRYWLETFRLPKMDIGEVAQRADANTIGHEYIEAALERGRGAILALPHQGNWDVAGVWLVANHGPFATVAERLKPDSLFDRFVAYRESLGFEVLPLTGGARPPLEVLSERLGQNKVVCLLADRDLSRSGVDVSFFGERTRMPGGPSMLAATTGAALLPVSLWFTDDGGWGQRINPPVVLPEAPVRDQVTAGTQSVADCFARDIAAHPTDWHMLQPLWLSDLPQRRVKQKQDSG
jgi:KDO2-lipid IV(A) lauroyltransferase